MGRGEGGGAGGSGGRGRASVFPPADSFREITTSKEAVETLADIYRTRNLNRDDVEAIEYYQTSSGASYMNSALRSAASDENYTPGETDLISIRNMDKAMRPLEENMVLYRGFGGSAGEKIVQKFNDGTLIGDFYSDAGYTSASIDKSAANSGRVRLKMRVPKGTKTFATNSLDGPYKHERELGVHRNSRWRIVDAYDNFGTLEVTVEYAGSGPKANWEK